MGFYENTVFPRVNDALMNDPKLTELRRELLASARGRVLEVGMGSGLNLPLYPTDVIELIGIDPNSGMNKRAAQRAKAAPFPVEVQSLRGESLPFEDESIDTVVSTFVLCTIAGVDRALSEISRVLKPSGQLLVLEHGLGPDPKVQRWQRRLNPIQRVLGCGCNLDRDIRSMLSDGGFAVAALSTFAAKGIPKTHGTLTTGAAVRQPPLS